MSAPTLVDLDPAEAKRRYDEMPDEDKRAVEMLVRQGGRKGREAVQIVQAQRDAYKAQAPDGGSFADRVAATALGAGETLAMGAADEAAGAANLVKEHPIAALASPIAVPAVMAADALGIDAPGVDAYRAGREAHKKGSQDIQDKAPNSYGVGMLTGLLAPAAGPRAAVSGGVRELAKAGAASGAFGGGMSGEGAGDRLEGAAKGAAVGALLAGGLGALGAKAAGKKNAPADAGSPVGSRLRAVYDQIRAEIDNGQVPAIKDRSLRLINALRGEGGEVAPGMIVGEESANARPSWMLDLADQGADPGLLAPSGLEVARPPPPLPKPKPRPPRAPKAAAPEPAPAPPDAPPVDARAKAVEALTAPPAAPPKPPAPGLSAAQEAAIGKKDALRVRWEGLDEAQREATIRALAAENVSLPDAAKRLGVPQKEIAAKLSAAKLGTSAPAVPPAPAGGPPPLPDGNREMALYNYAVSNPETWEQAMAQAGDAAAVERIRYLLRVRDAAM